MEGKEINDVLLTINIEHALKKIYNNPKNHIVVESVLWTNTKIWWYMDENNVCVGFIKNTRISRNEKCVWLIGLPESINRMMGQGLDLFGTDERTRYNKEYIPFVWRWVRHNYDMANSDVCFFDHFYDSKVKVNE